MPLEQIGHTYWVTQSLTPKNRQSMLQTQFGIPGHKTSAVCSDGKPLETTEQFDELLSKDLAASPQSMSLVLFAGALPGGWKKFVAEVYKICMKQDGFTPEEITETQLRLFAILLHITEVRDDINQLTPEALREAFHDILPLPEVVQNAVRQRVIMIMLSGGSDYVIEGKAAAGIGLINGAHDIMDISESETCDEIKAEIEKALQRRE